MISHKECSEYFINKTQVVLVPRKEEEEEEGEIRFCVLVCLRIWEDGRESLMKRRFSNYITKCSQEDEGEYRKISP